MTPQQLADQAVDVAQKLKPGTWEAVQALALASIAQSLAAMASQQERG
jgi:hypothetical protein